MKLQGMIEGLQILLTKGEPVGQTFAAEHDEFYIFAAGMDTFTDEEFQRLEDLGFHRGGDDDCFIVYC